MKKARLIAIFLILASIICCAFLTKAYIKDTTQKLNAIADEISEDIDKKDLVSCEKNIDRFLEIFEPAFPILEMIVSHEYVYDVYDHISCLKEDLDGENIQQMPSSAAQLKVSIRRIEDFELISIDNIF
jgi:hypothetical protein